MLRRAGASILLGASLVHCLEPLPAAEPRADSGASSGGSATGGAAGSPSGSGGLPAEASSDAPLDGQDASSDAQIDGGDLCADATPVDYELRRLPAGTAFSAVGFCSEAFWATVPSLALIKQANPATPSDNTATCKLVWSSESTPPVLWGCCVVSDKDIRGTMTTLDSEAWKDDGLELLLKGNEQPTFDSTTQKTIVSVFGGHRDSKWSSGIFDPSFNANVLPYHSLQTGSTFNDSIADKGFMIKWRQDLAFGPIAGQRARCDLQINDWDGAAAAATQLVAFGADHKVDMATAGTCRFSCAAP